MTLQAENVDRFASKPFLEHLADLRRAIIRMLIALVAGVALAIPLAPHVIRILQAPLAKVVPDPTHFLKIIDISGGLSVALNLILWTGILLSSPLLFLFAGSFIFPGLTRRERRAVLGGSAFAVVLFAAGVTMGYFLALPVALRVMLSVGRWVGAPVEFVTLNSYLALSLQVLIAFGLAFELPVVVLILGYLGLITSRQMREKRRHAIVLLFVIAMVLTPGPDVFSQVVMAVPLVLLYELCIWLIWMKERDRRPDAADQPADIGTR